MFTYGRTIGRFVEWADAEGIAPADIELFDVEDYFGSLAQKDGKPYSAHSLRTYCKDTRTLLNFAHDRKIFADRIKVELPKTKDDDVKALTDSELETVRAHFEGQAEADPTRFEFFRNAAIFHVLKDSGVRAAELLALDWADLSWDKERQLGTIQVTKQLNRDGEMVSPKNDKPRRTFFYADAWHYLMQMRIAAGWSLTEAATVENLRRGINGPLPPPEGYGWRTPEGKEQHPVFWLSYGDPERLGADGLGKMLRNAGKEVGIRLYPHLLRHTAGRLMTKAGLSPITIAQILGHSGLIMVMRYSKLWGEDLEDVVFEKMIGNGHGSA
jgi:integrase